jgi:pimeloyl-ACP methyl ester carboxylesterase
MTRVRINGVDLLVEPPAGDGELLVLVRGSWTDHATWAALVPLPARSYRVVRYDRRGHSLSGRGPEPPEPRG